MGGDGPTRIDRLRGGSHGGFTRSTLWTASGSDPLRVRRTRLGVADVDHDGRSDLVLFRQDATGATSIRVMKARYDGLAKGPRLSEPGLEWSLVQPY